MSHDVFSQYDAAYVLGALSPAERQAFEDHLESCGSCRRAVSEVAGLPGLLARVDPKELEAGEGGTSPGPVPDTLLPRLLAEVRRSQRRRRTWGIATGAAAAAAVAAVSVGVTVVQGDGHPSEVAGPPARVMKQVDQAQLSASLAMEDVAWGTRLSITCTYADGRYGGELPAYALVVHTRDGAAEQVATWRAVAGKPTTVVAATASRRSEITSVEVRTTYGEPVLTLKA
ncbi:MAG TPA: zf-HC2 domain-containing protein [Nocardioidaceae bacterium]|nr:zf-HC2 domain-containing protein [Nocardioidaceae bacterium]